MLPDGHGERKRNPNVLALHLGGPEEGALLLGREPAGRLAGLADRLGRGDLGDPAPGLGPFEQGADRRQLAVDAGRLELAALAELLLPSPDKTSGQAGASRVLGVFPFLVTL